MRAVTRERSLIPHTRDALIVGWSAVACHGLAFAGILTLIITNGR